MDEFEPIENSNMLLESLLDLLVHLLSCHSDHALDVQS
jgi:hypothetical protein